MANDSRNRKNEAAGRTEIIKGWFAVAVVLAGALVSWGGTIVSYYFGAGAQQSRDEVSVIADRVKKSAVPILRCGSVSDGKFEISGLVGRTIVVSGSAYGSIVPRSTDTAAGIAVRIALNDEEVNDSTKYAAIDFDIRSATQEKNVDVGASVTYAFIARETDRRVTVNVTDIGGTAVYRARNFSCVALSAFAAEELEAKKTAAN